MSNIVAGMDLRCVCDELGDLDVDHESRRMWAFVSPACAYDIFCAVEDAPVDLKIGDAVIGLVEKIRFSDQDNTPVVFLASAHHAVSES
jgi:hypothetical protein